VFGRIQAALPQSNLRRAFHHLRKFAFDCHLYKVSRLDSRLRTSHFHELDVEDYQTINHFKPFLVMSAEAVDPDEIRLSSENGLNLFQVESRGNITDSKFAQNP